jgi:hypothetical protein
VDGDHTAIPSIPANEEEMEAPPENATEDAVTIIDVATDNKYVKYASSMFERTSFEIIEISVWTAAFTWKEDDEDDWGRVPKEDELLKALRQKLIVSAKDMQRLGKRIHPTAAQIGD